MKQLTSADTSFLTMETATQFGHVGSLYVYDKGADYATTLRQIEERLHLLPPYRRQLVEVPFDLDHPYWIESPNFDLDFHVRHIAVPPPGDREQLADLVAHLASLPLDRSRPLWEWYVIEGLESGGVGHFAKTHHATIDGASGVELMTVLLDDNPVPSPPPPPTEPWRPDTVPSPAELLGRTFWNLAARPQQAARAQFRLWQELMERSRDGSMERSFRQLLPPAPAGGWWPWAGDVEGGRAPAPTGVLPTRRAPRTPFNATITAHRRWSYVSVPLAEVKRVKSHFGVTVNDVVLAVCAGALRRWLVEHDALPADPLLAMCPISTRSGGEADTYSNQVSAMIASLGTDIEDVVERLRLINRSTVAAKEQFAAVPAAALQDFAQFAPPAVAAQASRLLAQTRIADVVNPPFNVTISNVPGPREPLYLAGAQLRHTYPVSIVTDGMGLNITVSSYLDGLDFGLIACRELVPDLWRLNDWLADSLAELADAAT
ncbi:MAG: wax ester/triacylglycerol synthase family O-acyltransferase [Acidimicrobiia bacterium]|nr:wax ester/triacylglycerol synthase family O-acyltransferase [Acidimicrobiia bacterium]